MTTLWFITSASSPDKRLDGPFSSRDECERACLTRMSETNKIDAAWNHDGNVTRYFIPRPFKSEDKQTSSANQLLRTGTTASNATTQPLTPDVTYVSTYTPADDSTSKTVSRSRTSSSIKLPVSIYRFTHSQLLDLANTLGLEVTPAVSATNKQELVAIIEAYLSGE